MHILALLETLEKNLHRCNKHLPCLSGALSREATCNFHHCGFFIK